MEIACYLLRPSALATVCRWLARYQIPDKSRTHSYVIWFRRLGQEITTRLVSAFVLSRLDYCNALWLSYRHQHSYDCNGWCTQLLTCMRPFTKRLRDVTSALRSLHWLPVKQRIEFKFLSIRPPMDEHPPTSRTWLKRRRQYLAELRTAPPVTMTLLPGGRDWSSANVPSPSLHHTSGISCQQTLKLLQTHKPSKENWKRICSREPTCSKTHIQRRRKSNCYLWNIVMGRRSLCRQ